MIGVDFMMDGETRFGKFFLFDGTGPGGQEMYWDLKENKQQHFCADEFVVESRIYLVVSWTQ